jgi:hypothetical protein
VELRLIYLGGLMFENIKKAYAAMEAAHEEKMKAKAEEEKKKRRQAKAVELGRVTFINHCMEKLKKNTKVENVVFEKGVIMIRTNPLHVNMKGQPKTDIGKFNIEIKTNGNIRANHETRMLFPHHMPLGKLCWGNVEEIYDNLKDRAQPDYYGLGILTIEFLEKSWEHNGMIIDAALWMDGNHQSDTIGKVALR